MKKQPKIDPKEMEKLFKEHYSLLCLVSYEIVKDRDIAKDIVQDFFISFWQRRKMVFLTTSFKAYAIKAVKNLGLKYLERAKKEKLLISNLSHQDFQEENLLESNHHYYQVRELLDKIPESRRKILISAVVDGKSYSEIAENNDISINTVKTQMKRAYAFLRSEIKNISNL